MSAIVIAEHTIEAPYLHSTGPSLSRFFTALRDACEIWGRRCDRCAQVKVPPGDHCQTCAAPLGAWVRVGTEGVVTGRTVVERALPLVNLPPPFAFVRVRLDGADTDLIHLATDVARVTVGARVCAKFALARRGTIRDIDEFVFASASASASTSASGQIQEPITIVKTQLKMPFRLAAGAVMSRFADGLKRGELHGNRCVVCRCLYLPPRDVCARCFAPCDGWERISDRGRVDTFVVVNVPFYGQEIEIPYILGHIHLDGADTTFFHLVGRRGANGKLLAPDGGARLGMRVRAVWLPTESRAGLLNDDIDHFQPEDA